MKGKKFLAVIMAVMMIFAMCSCAAEDSDEPDKKEPASTSSEKTEKETATEKAAEKTEEGSQEEAADDEENELGLTGREMEEIYAEIEKALQEEYLDVNGIKVEDFSIPTDDESWDYFWYYISYKPTQLVSDEEYFSSVSSQFSLSEDNLDIMTCISDAFYNHFEKDDKINFILTTILYDEDMQITKELITSNVFADSSEAETE